MRQKELLDSIKKYLARFEAQVRISSLNGEYDINIHSENVIIPILNLIYSINLKNANYSEGKNNEAIDLLDEDQKIAFQVTSTKGIVKISSTITKFLTSKFKNKIDSLYIYVLKEKQNYYTQFILDKATDKKIKFNAKENIIDASDIYRKLNELNNLEIIEKVEEILRIQFSDVFIDKTYTLSNLESFRLKYKESCVANFSRINFFGLAVNTNKPREIELYLLFVKPTFSSKRGDIKHLNFHPSNELRLYDEATSSNTRVLIESSGAMESYTKFSVLDLYKRSLLEDSNLNEYLNANKIIRLGDTLSLNFFETFHDTVLRSVTINFTDLFSSSKNLVIIGKPGAGKSSFIKYTICKILEKDLTVFTNKEIYDFIPFRIELHKYNKLKKNKIGGIVEYLSELLKNEYQQTLKIENIVSILRSFPSIFFFDGLDEIFDIQERLEVRNDIETFIKTYKLLRSVVTSRYESYEEVSLTEELYTKLELLDFDEIQVEEYVKKWYAIEESSVALRERESHNCLTQLKSVEAQLKHNPLLLSLILLLYRNELDIPTSKLNIYESCANTIVETRDVKEKKLDIKLKIVNKISVFASLAYWQFKNESLGKGTSSFETIRAYVKNYLIEKGEFTDDNFAQQATDEFLDFAKLRSIYFENKFTHKTFLEYFAAYYIYSYYYSNWKKGEEFSELLTNYVGLSAWSVVLELLICKIDSTQINYEVIDDLVEKLYLKNKIDSLIFYLQILKYLRNISPRMTRFIISKSIEFCFKDGESTKELKVDYQEILFTHLSNLGGVERFKKVIENSFIEIIEKDKISNVYINIFAYEFAIVSGSTVLVKILQQKNLESDSEYIFILKHYPNLFDNSKFLESLKVFMNSFQASSVSNVYESPFRQKIFFNSERFNWAITFLLNNIAKESAIFSYQLLLNNGVSKEILIESSKKKSAEISTSEFEEKIKIINEKDTTYKRFIKNLQNTYFPIPETKPKNDIKFYHKFYISKSKKRR